MRFACLFLFAVASSVPAIAQNSQANQWIAFNRAGAANSNLQCFKPSNVSVAGGYLILTTRVENASCSSIDLPLGTFPYTSAFVSMRTFHFLYGTVEFRAKFGGGDRTGAWPTVWMLDSSCQASDPTGTDDACNGQEIDVAEILDGNFRQVNQQIHVDNFAHNEGCSAPVSDASRNFHTYQLVWSPRSLVFKIDGRPTCTLRGEYIPKAAMYVKISVYAGKSGGSIRNESLPWKTLIDYVKVTQGSSVVFNDEFNSETTIEPAPYAVVTPPTSSHRSVRSVIANAFEHWPAMVAVLSTTTVVALVAIRLRGPKRG